MRKSLEFSSTPGRITLILAGLTQNSGVINDLQRGGIGCCFAARSQNVLQENEVITFACLADAMLFLDTRGDDPANWTRSEVFEQLERIFSYPWLVLPIDSSNKTIIDGLAAKLKESNATVVRLKKGEVREVDGKP